MDLQTGYISGTARREHPVTLVNSIGMEFVSIPSGEFQMGSVVPEKNWYRNEGPVHKVNIKRSFYLGRYLVTQEQWSEIMENDPSKFKGSGRPVDRVSWSAGQEFIARLNEKEDTVRYRLPSEAEWEYACRAGSITRYSFGDSETELDPYCYYGNQDIGSHPVGEKKPNNWGLYDMHGNLWEWMQDVYHDSYDNAPRDGSAREDLDGSRSMRVLRGGSWQTPAVGCRSASRYYLPSVVRRNSSRVGLRLVRDV
ncbi:formylglycine-generating enzyme family protein [Methanolobus profundi]|uniref:Formylglycine-generating enzyme, required for sulfatase activity, contains SUMF1/FGE domain n=1 Tax=Methanolobus profundi TaxID=487685 RepID=A0A1I4PTV8_9EURY|nr:formylglycine-generating enzyme family protein [Methanolobus profundi]SFM31184.1 Formylglycine-generating enzyme, required for sulfatase activity, contains SUMF1/FGE domain [Methanolobus profundi]